MTSYCIQPYHMNGLNWRLVPDDPGRDNIVVVTGFMPAWWTQEYGITFGAPFHLDGEVHRCTLARMEEILRERFGDLPNFFCGDDYAGAHPVERACGDALIPALFGARVSFDDASGHPFAHGLHLTAEQTDALEVPDVAGHPIIARLLAPSRGVPAHPAQGWRTTGEPGFEGVINVAYKLRGQELFLDMVEAPERARHLFEVVWRTIHDCVQQVRTWQDPGGSRPRHFVNCNCLVNLISPAMYREQLLEFDQRFGGCFDLFGIHTCNWTVDPYLEDLARVPRLAYLDMGAESDLDRVHRLFPDLRPSMFVHPQRLKELSEREIGALIAGLGRRIGRGTILLSDLEAGTRDSQIRAAYEAAARC